MCDPMTAIAAAAAVGGSYMQNREQEKAYDKRDKIMLGSMQRQNQVQAGINDMVDQSRDKYSVDQMQQGQQGQADQLAENVHQSLQQAHAAPQEGGIRGKISHDFIAETARNEVDLAKEAAGRARLYGNAQSARYNDFENAIEQSKTGNRIGQAGVFNQGDSNVERLRYGSVQPDFNLLATSLQAGGQTMLPQSLGQYFAGPSAVKPGLTYNNITNRIQ